MLQVGTRGNINAQILIVGEAWSHEEERKGQPFVGSVGKELHAMLQEAGIDPNNCYYTCVINKRPSSNDIRDFFFSTKEARVRGLQDIRGLYPNVIVLEGMQRLEQLIEKLQPKIIIAAGNYALWALTEQDFKITNSKGYKCPTGITNFRGSQLRSRFNNLPLLPIYHPSTVLRQYPWRYQVVHDLRARVVKAFRGDWDDPLRNFIIRPSFEQAADCLNDLTLKAQLASSPMMITADVETQYDQLRVDNPTQRIKSMFQLECVGIGWSKSDAMCLPLMCRGDKAGYWQQEEEFALMKMMKTLLEHPNVYVAGQNFSYDMQYFWTFYGTRPNYKHDTMLAHHVCFPGTPMGLDYLSSLYCSYHRYWKEDGKEANKNHDDEQRWIYNARDCVVTYEAMTELWKVIKHYNLSTQYAIQMTRVNSALQMMVRGVKVSEETRRTQSHKLFLLANDLQALMDTLLPESIYPRPAKKAAWYGSPQQLAEIFYDVLGQKEITNFGPNGMSRTTDDEALSKIANREPLLRPLCSALQKYRSLKVFRDFLSMSTGADKRIRTTFSPTTETFRYRSSSDVFGNGRNLQNIPVGTEE